jgi:putative mycofactocin binding protein MftB
VRCLLANTRAPGLFRQARRSTPGCRSGAARAWRKLSFLKTPELVTVVSGLENHPDVHAAIDAAGVEESQRPAYLRALAGLAANGTIEER